MQQRERRCRVGGVPVERPHRRIERAAGGEDDAAARAAAAHVRQARAAEARGRRGVPVEVAREAAQALRPQLLRDVVGAARRIGRRGGERVGGLRLTVGRRGRRRAGRPGDLDGQVRALVGEQRDDAVEVDLLQRLQRRGCSACFSGLSGSRRQRRRRQEACEVAIVGGEGGLKARLPVTAGLVPRRGELRMGCACVCVGGGRSVWGET